ncbi:intracellular short-chain-length polyhydroxyalkanoate depolymerase [Paenibacillus thiaminolyticus]|uniref:intracellular short-chain-length polyhydroxyalkanoate depolymerase n=1 Tax=Paenibacillus thiaminolyticus TaxID=49283 RepID=UPI002542B238|nr:alpha/beta hydrolase [Paenibacillus thiaminolyticus]WII38744.1 alpha/beta hydrolase [Paenibacillus thiaminolyticus]
MKARVTLKSVLLPNGETLGYREREGGEEVLLLIHGNMNSSCHWDVALERLDPRYKLYAIDLRGFGISTYHEPIRALRDLAIDVKLFSRELELDRFAVMGWSTGGGVAMELAADWPEAVTKLILLASVSTRGYPFHEDGGSVLPDRCSRIVSYAGIEALERNRLIAAAIERGDRVFLKRLYEAVIYDKNRPEEDRYEAYLDDMLTQRNLMDVYHALNTFNVSMFDHVAAAGSGAVRRVAAPTLVLRGDRDMVISEAMAAETLADLGEIARFIPLKDCGHSPLVDDPAQLLQAVEAFLAADIVMQPEV